MANIRATSRGTFKGLVDTPDSYAGQSDKFVKVKSDETGLEFSTSSSVDTANVLLTNVDCAASVFVGACVRMSGGVAVNANASSFAESNFKGICENKSASTLCDIRVLGTTGDIFSNLDETKEYYLSTTDGQISDTIPTGTGTVILRIGQPFTDKSMLVLKGQRTVRA